MRRLLCCPVVLAAQQPKALTLTRTLFVDGDKELFERTGHVTPLRDGGFVIANERGVMRFYDAAGTRVGSYGRAGEGPDEFQVIPGATLGIVTLPKGAPSPGPPRRPPGSGKRPPMA